MSRIAFVLLLLASLPATAGSSDGAIELGGIRLEEGQLERLADELAVRTLAAVESNLSGLGLRSEQRERMRVIYAAVALDVFRDVVELQRRDDLDDGARAERVRERVLAGQRRSSAELEAVLDRSQLERYRTWEAEQVEAFRRRPLESPQRSRR